MIDIPYKFVDMRKAEQYGTSTCVIQGNVQSLEIYQCPRSHGVFAVDSSWLDSNRFVVSPFDPLIIFDFGRVDAELEEETVAMRNEWLEENTPDEK